jgi:hypothetical protein
MWISVRADVQDLNDPPTADIKYPKLATQLQQAQTHLLIVMSILDLASSHVLAFPSVLSGPQSDVDVAIDAAAGFRALQRRVAIRANGFARRSAALTNHMRCRKQHRAHAVHRSVEMEGLRALRTSFNRRQLRHGDRVIAEASAASRKRRIHKNQWTLEGTILAAYKSVGSREPNMGLGKTRRTAEVASAVGFIHDKVQKTELRARCLAKAKAKQLNAIVLVRGFDCTPWLVSFGSLEMAVSPHARYFVKQDNGKWKSVSIVDYQAAHKLTKRPSRGTLECLAQTFDCSWLDLDGLVGIICA